MKKDMNWVYPCIPLNLASKDQQIATNKWKNTWKNIIPNRSGTWMCGVHLPQIWCYKYRVLLWRRFAAAWEVLRKAGGHAKGNLGLMETKVTKRHKVS